MASEDDTTQVELLEFGKNSEVIFEAPSRDFVKSIDKCFKQFRRDASNHTTSSDSDSGDSLFITQSVTAAVRTVRRRKSTHRSKFISDDSEDGREERCIENEDDEYEDGGLGHRQHPMFPGKNKWPQYIPPKKNIFPFLFKSQKQQHLPRLKHQILENAEVGGFFKCIKKIQEGSVNTQGAEMWEFGLTEDSELDEHNSDHEVTVVDKAVFALNKQKRDNRKWPSKFILKKRIKVKPLESKKSYSAKKDLAQTKKNACSPSKKRRTRRKSHATIPDSPSQSTSCTDTELSDSASPRQLLTNHIRSDKKSALDGDHLCVIEEAQGLNSVVAASEAEQEVARAEPDSTSFSPQQGGDMSLSNYTRDESGSETLLPDDEEEENEDVNIQTDDPDETLIVMEDRNDDSDVTQIVSQIGESVSKSGPGTPRPKGKSHPCAADETSQHSSQDILTSPDSQSLLVRGGQEDNGNKQTNKLQKVLTDIDLHDSSTKCSESQDASQSFVPHVELLPESAKDKKVAHSEDADGEEANVIQQASGPVKPVRDVVSSTTETGDSPLFKHVGQSFLKRKRRKEEKINKDSDLMQRDVDASSPCHGDDVTRLKTTRKDNRESREMEDNGGNEESETAELSEETSMFSLGSDMTVVSQVKKKKAKKQKLEEQNDAELAIDTQHTQDTESQSKRAKKKRKDKKMHDQGNDATISLSNKSLPHIADRPLEQGVNYSIQATKIDHSEHTQKPEGVTQEPSDVVEHMERKRQIIALKKASEPLETTCNLEVSDSRVITKVKKKKKDQHKVKQKDVETGSDTHSVENVEYGDSQSMVLCSRKTKKRKDKERDGTCDWENNEMVRTSINLSKDIAESPVELEANDSINSSEANQPENTQKSEEITKCSSPSVTILRSGKKKKKKKKTMDGRERHQHDSPNVNLDVCSVSLFDEVAWVPEEENGSTTQEERPTDVLEHLKNNTKAKLNDGKGKKKRKDKKMHEHGNDAIISLSKESMAQVADDSPYVNLDVCSVSLFDEVALEEENGSTTQEYHLKSNTKAELNDAKGKKKRKEDSTEDSYPVVQSEEMITPEMRKKKRKNKRHTDDVMTINSEMHLVCTDREDFGNSVGSPVSTQSEKGLKKTKRKNNEEINEPSKGACPTSQAIAQTKHTDSVIQQNNVKKTVVVASLEDSGDVRRKKRKKDIECTNSNNEIISCPEVNTSVTPKMPERGWEKNRCGEAENICKSHKIQETEFNPEGEPCAVSAQDNLESQTDDAFIRKKKKRKRVKESAYILDTQNTSSHSCDDKAENILQSRKIQETEFNSEGEPCAVSAQDNLESQTDDTFLRKKKKRKRVKESAYILDTQNTSSHSCDDEAENILQSRKIQETEFNPEGDSCAVSAQDNSESQTDDVFMRKKKKRKREKESVSILDTQIASSQDKTVRSQAEKTETFLHNDDVLFKKKKRKCIENDY